MPADLDEAGGRAHGCCYHSGVADSHRQCIGKAHLRTVFLDRDGVLNEKMPEGRYVTAWNEFRVLPGVPEAIAPAQSRRVSRDRGVEPAWHCAGALPGCAVEAIQGGFQKLLEASGAYVDAFYYCPHDKRQCDCRKPLPGMFEQAQREFPEINAATSAMIGDSLSDIEFGRRLGMLTVFIEGAPERQKPGAGEAREMATLRFPSLPAAVDALLAER